MTLTGYDAWLSAPYVNGPPDGAEDAYDQYLEWFDEEIRAEFTAGGHDAETLEEFRQAVDEPQSYDDFVSKWMDDQEEAARDRYYENRYPDARI